MEGGEQSEQCDRQGAVRRLSDRETFAPDLQKKGERVMTDYEMLMIVLAFMSLVMTILINKK